MTGQRIDWPLTLSLALNLVLVVFIGIGLVRLGAPPVPHGWGMMGPPREQIVFMGMMRDSMAGVLQEQPGLKDSLEKKRKVLNESLVTEPFDRARFEAAQKEFDAVMDTMRHLIKAHAVERIATLSLEQRRDLAAMLSRLPPPPGHAPP